jgi:hypothetical protein
MGVDFYSIKTNSSLFQRLRTRKSLKITSKKTTPLPLFAGHDVV